MSTSKVVLDDKSSMDIFLNKVEFKLGTRDNTFFWLGRWSGDKILKGEFPNVFSKIANKFGKVCEFWNKELGAWKWDIGISREVLF